MPSEEGHYLYVQNSWIEKERQIVKFKLGKEPTSRELSDDYDKYRNGERFRLFYLFKFPERMVGRFDYDWKGEREKARANKVERREYAVAA